MQLTTVYVLEMDAAGKLDYFLNDRLLIHGITAGIINYVRTR